MNPPIMYRKSKKCKSNEWFSMYEKLQEYKRDHNTCNVPKRYKFDQKLGHWVHYQRTMYKANKLSQDRKELLESIGFVWSERQSSNRNRGQISWEERFEELKKFRAIHGHCKVPRKGKDAALGRWVKWQKWNKTLLDRGSSSVLTKERIGLLNTLGFSWGHQRSPQEKSIQASSSDESQSIEPLPFRPTRSPTSNEENERTHVVSPQFSSLPLMDQLEDTTWRDRPPFSTFKGFNDFVSQEVTAPIQFNHEQVNFAIPAMPSFEEDSKRYSKQVTECSNESFQSLNSSNGGSMTKGIQGAGDFAQSMESSSKFNQEMGTGSCSTVWKCSVCRYAAFDTYDEALAHENNCTDLYEGNFCRACAA